MSPKFPDVYRLAPDHPASIKIDHLTAALATAGTERESLERVAETLKDRAEKAKAELAQMRGRAEALQGALADITRERDNWQLSTKQERERAEKAELDRDDWIARAIGSVMNSHKLHAAIAEAIREALERAAKLVEQVARDDDESTVGDAAADAFNTGDRRDMRSR